MVTYTPTVLAQGRFLTGPLEEQDGVTGKPPYVLQILFSAMPLPSKSGAAAAAVDAEKLA